MYALVELMGFGTLSKFYKNMKNEDKKAVARMFKVGYTYFESWIESIAYVRNICAHYGRLYNNRLVKAPKLYKQYANIGNKRIFATLLTLKHILPCDARWRDFVSTLELLITNYPSVKLSFIGFPQNWPDYLIEKTDELHIETSRLILRPFTESDAAVASYNSRQSSVVHFMSEMVKDTEEAALSWIRYVNNKLFDIKKPCVLFAVVRKKDELCIGCIFVHRKEEWGNVVELGYYIADEYQNNGYATEAGKAMILWVFERARQDVLSAFVKPDNKASRRVIEKLGFSYKNKLTLPHNGAVCTFDYYRFDQMDILLAQ